MRASAAEFSVTSDTYVTRQRHDSVSPTGDTGVNRSTFFEIVANLRGRRESYLSDGPSP